MGSLRNLLENVETDMTRLQECERKLGYTEDAADQVIGYFSVSGVDYKRYFMNA